MSDFVHLHVHSHYSLLDGGITIKNLVKTAQEMGMPALSLTDHGNMFGAVEFYLACKDAGIKPIIGYEAYMAPNSRLDKTGSAGGISDAAYHLTLLVKDIDGYMNLMKLASLAYLEGYYYRPRIDKELLDQHSKGLIALSGCLASETSEYLQEDRLSDAMQVIDDFRNIFEPGHFFLEVQENGILEQNTVNENLVKIANDTGLPLVATNDIHYVGKDDYDAHDTLLCIGTAKKKGDTNRLRFERNEFYFKTADEMKEAFKHAPEAVANTRLVEEMVGLELDFNAYHHPVFKCPEGKTAARHLRDVATQGMHKRYEHINSVIQERLDYELDSIDKMGFSSYLLIVWDIVRFGRESDIPVGPGRGSAVGSLVCYCLEITNLDPFKYDLIFERFMNPGRNEMPDIDLDFCQARRGEMIDYVTQKYGRDCVCQIITFNTLGAKASLRDVGRVLEVPLSEVDKLAKKVPDGVKVKLDDALADAEFVKMMEGDARYQQLVDTARRLEGLARNPGIHAAGVIIADRDVSEYCPLYRPPGTEDVTTQYDMKMVEKIGLLKIDFLGLANLTLIQLAVDNVSARHGIELNPDEFPLDDQETYALLGRGEAKGIFQFESDGMRQLLVSAKPNCLEDLIALNAMYRPGPMQNIPSFVARKQGKEKIEYMHPSLEPVLANSYGIIIYQEQVIRIANQVAGFNLSDADSLRLAMGKKIRSLMDSYKQPFIDGAMKNAFTQEQATQLWDQLEQFAEYGFNKSHAAAYAYIAFQNAYLKAHYPGEFMAALLTIETGNTDKVSEYIQECRRMGISVLPPEVNISGAAFTPVDEGIRFGLGAVKGVGSKPIEAIVASRTKEGPFKSIFDFCERIDHRMVNRQTIDSLIRCGGYDSTGAKRSQLIQVIDDAIQMGSSIQADRAAGQMNLFGGGGTGETAADDPELPEIEEFEKLQLLAMERETLGFFITGHPLEAYREIVNTFTTATTSSLQSMHEGENVAMLGIITSTRSTMTRNGRMVRIMFEDLEGAREISIFSDLATKAGDLLSEDNIILITGSIQSYRDRPDIRVREVYSVEEVYQKLTRRLLVRLGGNDEADNQIVRLRRILRAHRGRCQVLMEIPLDNGTRALIAAGEQFTVTPDSNFRSKVADLLGQDALRFSAKLDVMN